MIERIFQMLNLESVIFFKYGDNIEPHANIQIVLKYIFVCRSNQQFYLLSVHGLGDLLKLI